MDDETMQRLREKLDEILPAFGKEYEWPYRFMLDNNRSAASQQTEAQSSLLAETKANILQAVAAEIERAEVAAQTNAVAWTVGVIDDLHSTTPDRASLVVDMAYKGVKNTLRDRYKAETGVDPAPDYPIHAKLHHQNNLKRDDGGSV
jgi:predicted RNA-binding protein with EMAP domain